MKKRIDISKLFPSNKEEALKMLTSVYTPIAICNGQEFLDEEGEALEELFKIAEVEYEIVDNLFEEKKDLSKYKTIAFGTTYVEPEKVQKILDFDKSNLKTVIVFDSISYNIVRKYGKGLKLNVLGFNDVSFRDFKEGFENKRPIMWDALKSKKDKQDGYSGPFGWKKGEMNIINDYNTNTSLDKYYTGKYWFGCSRPQIFIVLVWLLNNHNIFIQQTFNKVSKKFEVTSTNIDTLETIYFSEDLNKDQIFEALEKAIKQSLITIK